MEKEIKKEKKITEEEYEDAVMVAYQKKNEIDGWQRIELSYKKKKK